MTCLIVNVLVGAACYLAGRYPDKVKQLWNKVRRKRDGQVE